MVPRLYYVQDILEYQDMCLTTPTQEQVTSPSVSSLVPTPATRRFAAKHCCTEK